ncbi:MAG TPA: hypothetical protein VMZ27_00305, partial [Candidatus Saccharimonadales bacterium]|nr:hypothetical protein [Candidatus Saccharimonadales bacterium]
MRQNAFLLPRLFAALALLGGASVQAADIRVPTAGVLLIELEDPNHEVMVFPAGGTLKEPATLNRVLKPGDRLQTGSRSRATIRLRDLTPFRVRPNALVEVPDDSVRSRILNVLRGAIYLFHRDKP